MLSGIFVYYKKKMENTLFGKILNSETLESTLSDVIDGEVKNINSADETKKLLATRIEKDIQQYLDDSFEEKPVVIIDGNDAYVTYEGKRLVTTMFYCLVFNNQGIVTKELFDAFAKEYEKPTGD